MADISHIKGPDNTSYDIKDEMTRDLITVQTYNINTQYYPGNIVIMGNPSLHSLFFCQKANTPGTYDSSCWTSLASLSDYVSLILIDLCPLYVESIGYKAGDIRRWNGNIYKCKENIAIPAGPFDSSNWELTTTSSRFTDIDFAIDKKVSKAGDTMTGSLDLLGSEINLKTVSSSSNDSGDIVWFYGNGQEKARVWTDNSPTTVDDGRLNFRCYKSDGTALSSGKLATSSDVDGKVSKSGDTMTGNLKLEGSSQPSVLFKESGYGDKFEIKPSFGGTDESNYLAIKTATGGSGTDPSTSDKIRIRPSGKLEFVNTSRNIEVPTGSISYVDGAKGNAGLYMPHTYNTDAWRPIMCVQTKAGGSWSIGNYNNDHLSFVKFTKANIDSSTNTMQCQIDLAETGAVETSNGSFIAKDTANPASPSSGSLYGKGFYLRDAANDDYAYLRHHYSGAEKGLQLEVRRSVNGSYTYNTLNMRINASGGKIIQVSDAGAWRSAIGAQATLSNSDLSYTRVNGNVSNDAKCRRYGNIVEFTGQFGVSSSSLARDTILWNGFPKPKTVVYFTARCEGNWTAYSFYISTNGEIKNQQASIPAGTYNCNLVYICQ